MKGDTALGIDEYWVAGWLQKNKRDEEEEEEITG